MAFLGRRKPGFSADTSLTRADLTGEFSDQVDPAVRKQDYTPNVEKKEWQEQAAETIGLAHIVGEHAPEIEQAAAGSEAPLTAEELAEIAAREGTRMDLLDFLESQPDVPDPFKPSEPEPEEETKELSLAQLLADFITERTKAALLSSAAYLREEVGEQIDTLLPQMEADPLCASIKKIQGANEAFYYDSEFMTDNYAMIAVLVEDKNVPNTIAQMVRFNCKTYPSSTPIFYFTRHPYYLSNEELEAAREVLRTQEAYGDIHEVVSKKGSLFFYSDQYMTAKYARALADFGEEDETD